MEPKTALDGSCSCESDKISDLCPFHAPTLFRARGGRTNRLTDKANLRRALKHIEQAAHFLGKMRTIQPPEDQRIYDALVFIDVARSEGGYAHQYGEKPADVEKRLTEGVKP